MAEDDLSRAQTFIDALPHCKALGMRVTDLGPGTVSIQMPYDPELVGDPETGIIHGGAVSALMDSTSGAAVHAYSEDVLPTATLDLRIDYMRPATPGQTIRARAECYHVTRSIVFTRAVAVDDDEGRPVATATGAFTFERRA